MYLDIFVFIFMEQGCLFPLEGLEIRFTDSPSKRELLLRLTFLLLLKDTYGADVSRALWLPMRRILF